MIFFKKEKPKIEDQYEGIEFPDAHSKDLFEELDKLADRYQTLMNPLTFTAIVVGWTSGLLHSLGSMPSPDEDEDLDA